MKSLLSLLGRYLLTLSAVAVATLLAFILWKALLNKSDFG